MAVIKVNDINLYYESHGSGEPLILIAGFSGDHTAWQTLVEIYSKHYQVIIFDNRGSGSSDVPDYPYTTELMADDVAQLLVQLNITKAHVLGHSYGGCIAQVLAHKYPQLIKSLILVSTLTKASMRAQLYIDTRLKFIQSNPLSDAVTQFIISLCWSNSFLSKPGMLKNLVDVGFFPITLPGYINQAAAVLRFDSTRWIHQINVPTLIITSNEDLLADMEDSEFITRSIVNSQYFCFHKVGHVPYIEQPEIFNQVVLTFMKDVDQR